MVGGRTLWLSCLLTSSAVLLLGVSLSDVEASSCHQRTIHKRVGDAVELSTCLSPDESRQLIVARWKKGETEVADKDSHGSKVFRDRFYQNPTNLSLTVRKLTLQDSGEYSFLSEVNNHQLQTVFITLHVHDVEASSCQRTIHKRVGDDVQLSTCLSLDESHQLTYALWKQGETHVAEKDSHGSKVFRDRFYQNPTNFSLTVRKLTLQDSGEYSFLSEVNNHQLQTAFITLHVHEPITQHPDLQVNSTRNELNKTCRVLLECSSVYNTNVNYSLSVRNQTHSGSRLQFSIRPEDGETTFTCTISDFVSEMSASKTLTCSNSTESLKPPKPFEQENTGVVPSAAVRGCALIIIIVGSAVAVSRVKRTQMTQTVYDRIQLSRVRKPSTPNQEI